MSLRSSECSCFRSAALNLVPFVLSNLLLPVLARNRGTIVSVGSEQHRWVRAIP
jgi:hypothetical protein